jgi:predicted kinase
MGLCYKAYMRKWMRERIKRRKKPEETPGTESNKPAPLQPDYYDAQAAASGQPAEKEKDFELPAPGAEAPEEVAPALNADGETAGTDAQPRRRRRSRGGRGRGGARSGRSGRAAEASNASPAGAPEESAPAPVFPEVPSSAPVPVPAPASRSSKGVVVLAIGLPGSGKSSWFKRHQINPLSSDLLRALLFDDAQEQRFQDLVFSNLRSMLKARLIARRPMNYVDATNLTPQERHHWIKLGKDYGYEVHAVFFDVPLEVCLDRNRRRQIAVDEAVMHRMSSKLRAPTFDEGFSKITVVRVKKKDDGESAASEAL